MSEYINIISCEELTKPATWPAMIVGTIAIIGLLSTLWYFFKSKNYDKTVRLLAIFGAGGIVLMLATIIISAFFFRVPSGIYRYEATVDKENITVSEYEEFLDTYNPTKTDKETYIWEGDKIK